MSKTNCCVFSHFFNNKLPRCPQKLWCSCRSDLTLQPVIEGDEQYEHSESFSYENLRQKPDECVEKTCHHHSDAACIFKVNMVPVRDTVMSHSTQEYDQPYILHLWPTVLLRNLLPYPITYSLMVFIVLLKL